MSVKSRIIVTSKGSDLQFQVLRETLSEFPKIQSPQDFTRIRRTKINHAYSISPTVHPPPRAGYFGPKKPDNLNQESPTSQSHLCYPSYMKKDPKSYPPRHVCLWRGESTVKGRPLEGVVPKGKYIHHSFYNSAMETKLVDNPTLSHLNRITHGNNWNLREELTKEELRKDRQGSISPVSNLKILEGRLSQEPSRMSSQLGFSQSRELGSSIVSAKFRGTATSFNRSSSMAESMSGKQEKILKKYMENEKDYEQMLTRFDREIQKNAGRYEEDQHEAPDFIKKMRETMTSLEGLKAMSHNEDTRYVKRLKQRQNRKYEGDWKVLDQRFGSNRGTPINIRTVKQEKGIRGGALYNVAKATVEEEEVQVVEVSNNSQRKSKAKVENSEPFTTRRESYFERTDHDRKASFFSKEGRSSTLYDRL